MLLCTKPPSAVHSMPNMLIMLGGSFVRSASMQGKRSTALSVVAHLLSCVNDPHSTACVMDSEPAGDCVTMPCTWCVSADTRARHPTFDAKLHSIQ